jgi:hypothetical protein
MPPCTMGLEMPRVVVSNVEIGIGRNDAQEQQSERECGLLGAVDEGGVGEQQGSAERGRGQRGKGNKGRRDGRSRASPGLSRKRHCRCDKRSGDQISGRCATPRPRELAFSFHVTRESNAIPSSSARGVPRFMCKMNAILS